METSATGLAFISREEGVILHPYNDSRGFATVFVGHLIAQRPVIPADFQRFAPLTREHAIEYLRRDVRVAESAVNGGVKVPLNQNEFDALVSLTFNIGNGAFAGSTVLRRLNAGDRRGAADAFLMWHIGGAGLIFRRQRERTLFLTAAVDPLEVLEPDELNWVHELDVLRNKHQNVERRKELVAVLTKRRKHIWRTAQHAGWEGSHRRERYAILKDRTTRH